MGVLCVARLRRKAQAVRGGVLRPVRRYVSAAPANRQMNDPPVGWENPVSVCNGQRVVVVAQRVPRTPGGRPVASPPLGIRHWHWNGVQW